MQSTLDWAKLYGRGRCKDIGVPWSDEERKAVYDLKIPVDFVRRGILTEDDYVKALEDEAKYGKSLDREPIEKVREIAVKEGVVVTPETPKSVLLKEIKQIKDRKKAAAEQLKALEKVKEEEAKEAKMATAREEKKIAKEESKK